MVKVGDFSSMLHDEVMTEMAESFFSARKAVDDEIDLFEAKEADVALAGQRALCRCALLRSLLLGDEGAKELFAALGVDIEASGLLVKVQPVEPCLFIPLPWGLSMKNRFATLLLRVYSSVYDAFEAYLNGSGYTMIHEIEATPLYTFKNEQTGLTVSSFEAGSHLSAVSGRGASAHAVPPSLMIKGRRPGRTVGWKRYVSWCAEINAHIDEVNGNHAPSQVLGMARMMDVGTITQERASGTGVDGLDAAMDTSLCLRPVACHLAGVGDLPVLPEPETVKTVVKDYAKRFYVVHSKAVLAEIARLERQQECMLNELAEL